MVTCGAAFDFFGGRVKMAPLWIQRSGFEWLYRLLSKDFSRLWRRYTIDNGRFIFNFLLQLLGIRVRKPNTISRDLTVARDTALLQKS
jgi:N-acetylglucosaminyldiphosphoundecaprenol N-acetyl-beta-D-mannosaminyltransferase